MSSETPRIPARALFIVGNEACERLSFYGMSAVLTLYMVKELGMHKDTATSVSHIFKAGVYFLPLLGALIADRWLGRYRTILTLSVFYCFGHLALALFEGTTWGLYLGLALIALGAGGIKPCVSAFIGDQFDESNQALLAKAYSLFYWAINFGSFFAFAIIPWVRDSWGYSWAFGIPGILMGLALIIFYAGSRTYTKVPPAGKKPGFMAVFAASFRYEDITPIQKATLALGLIWLACAALAPDWLLPANTQLLTLALLCGVLLSLENAVRVFLSKSFWNRCEDKFDRELLDGSYRVAGVIGLFSVIPVFWALFDQTSTTWVLQGAKMIPISIPLPLMDTPWRLDAESIQALNPALVMMLIPLLTLVAYPLAERLGLRPRPLRRMTLGMAITALSFVACALIQTRVDAGAQLSILWQGIPYLLLTVGEVLFSTTGLEFAFTQAPKSMKSTLMSFWLLTVAVGNFLVAGFAAKLGERFQASGMFLLYAALMGVVTVAFAFLARRYARAHSA